ncbi:hypothetical protein [Corallococcus macrosporus]|uniref:hypothetical protein n=1 Tax=Corallococcus macrosporus TaxID=35 RepID=UPI000F505FEB|nr:hypothetical protein [Corallococcus macrosporus]
MHVRDVHLATELANISEMAPEALGSLIAEIAACLLRILSALSLTTTVGAKWIVKHGGPVTEPGKA